MDLCDSGYGINERTTKKKCTYVVKTVDKANREMTKRIQQRIRRLKTVG
jgi:hypothetical protein